MKEIISKGQEIYAYIKNLDIPKISFLRYCKDIANFSGYFGHAWPSP